MVDMGFKVGKAAAAWGVGFEGNGRQPPKATWLVNALLFDLSCFRR